MTPQQFLEKISNIYKDNLETCRQKNADYAGASDPFRNFEACNLYGITTEHGLLVRMSDKMVRISNLLTRNAEVKDEKITDSLKDLCNYSAILCVYLENKTAEDATPTPTEDSK